MKAIIAHIPVWCANYKSFLAAHADVEIILLIGSSFTKGQKPFVKDLRSLDPHEICHLLSLLNVCRDVRVWEKGELHALEGVTTAVLPDEEISRQAAEHLPSGVGIQFDTAHLLRWDAVNATKNKELEGVENFVADDFFRNIDERLTRESRLSPDLWRQVGAALIDSGKVIMTRYNECVPSSNHLLCRGDPRGQFGKGDKVDLSIFFHAEAAIVAEAAKTGLSLEGKEIYVTTFPCPPCGKLISYSGIRKLYYKEGYAMLDSEEILRANGVQIVKVKF